MTASAILFPLGVRLSTWVGAGGFLLVAVLRHDRRPLLAAAAWITGFEGAFQIVSLFAGKLPLGAANVIFWVIVAAVTLWVTRDIRPDWRILAAAVSVLLVWAVIGFHPNTHQHAMFVIHPHLVDFDFRSEVLNETSKTLWALAYLVPLTVQAVRHRTVRRGSVPTGSGLRT